MFKYGLYCRSDCMAGPQAQRKGVDIVQHAPALKKDRVVKVAEATYHFHSNKPYEWSGQRFERRDDMLAAIEAHLVSIDSDPESRYYPAFGGRQ